MIKQALFSVLIFICLLNPLTAQHFRAGISAGPAVTDVAGTTAKNFQKLGFTAGVLVNSALSQRNTLQLEINFTKKGSMQKPDSLNNGFFKLDLNYIEIPVLFKHRLQLTLFKKPISKFDLEFGLSAGRLIRYNYSANNYSQAIDPGSFNYTDLSLLFGIDYNFTSNFYFCLRYSNSVIPATKRNKVTSPLFLPATFNQGNNMVFQFVFKVIFGSAGSGIITHEHIDEK